MKSHSRTFEQYCCVMEKNIIMEETCHTDGQRELRCIHHMVCAMNGGCKNQILKPHTETGNEQKCAKGLSFFEQIW